MLHTMDLSNNQIGELGAQHLLGILEQNRVIFSSVRLFLSLPSNSLPTALFRRSLLSSCTTIAVNFS